MEAGEGGRLGSGVSMHDVTEAEGGAQAEGGGEDFIQNWVVSDSGRL